MEAEHAERLAALGRCPRARRCDLGLTQTELGHRVQWTQERISALECGTYGGPSIPHLALLAEALELSIVDLLTSAGYSTTVMRGMVPPTPAAGDGGSPYTGARRTVSRINGHIADAWDQLEQIRAQTRRTAAMSAHMETVLDSFRAPATDRG